jgi:tRNA/rRNA methyltransferase
MMTSPFEHISIVLVRPQHSGNIGAIARSIANHGLGQLIMVDPPAFDPDRARWMAPHAHHIINQARFASTVEEAIGDAQLVIGTSARNRAWNIPFIDIPEFCETASKPQRISLLFGPEDSGLSNVDMQFCHTLIALPTHHHQSLNLSQAVNVFGGHLMQSATSPVGTSPTITPSMSLQNRVIDAGMRVLDNTSFMSGKNPLHVKNTLVQLLGKANVTKGDLVFLKSICDKTYHTLRVLKEK